LDAVLEAKKFPAGIADLNAGLSDVDGDNFTHCVFFWFVFLKVFLEKNGSEKNFCNKVQKL